MRIAARATLYIHKHVLQVSNINILGMGRDGQDHNKSDLDQIIDHESNNDLDLI